MPDLETMLRDHFRAETVGLVADDRLNALVHRRRRRRHRAQNLGVVGVAAVVLSTLLLGTRALVALGTPAPTPVVVGDDLAGTDGERLFLVPATLPAGFELDSAFGPDDEATEPLILAAGWDGVQRWVQFDADGHPAAVIDVQWGPGPSTGDDPLEPYRAGSTEVVAHGSTFLLSDAAGWVVGLTGGTDLAGAGPVLRVSGVYAPEGNAPGSAPAPLSDAVLRQVLDRLANRRGGGLALVDPPDGFELAGEWPGEAHTGDGTRGLLYREAGGRSFEVWMANDSEVPLAASLGTAGARRLQVRGRAAVSTSYPAIRPAPAGEPLLFLDGDARFLEWVEPTGDRVVIAGLGLTDAELLAVAESLEPVDAAAWDALRDQPRPGAGSTTTTAPTSTTTTAAPLAAGSGLEHVFGSYDGTEHYTLVEDGPCDLDHMLDATWHLDDGSVWLFHHEYCGLLDGDLWTYGGGTASLTAPDGSTIEVSGGPHSARAPTFNDPDGDGIRLEFEGGTGRFAGITGGCRLHNRVTQVALGTQYQDGTFTCDFVP